jgi:hypothetical protein
MNRAVTEAQSTKRVDTVAALGTTILLFALLGGPLVRGRFYLYDDLFTFHLPLRVFYGRCLAAGDDFRWFPQYYCGFDLHGEGQIGLFHPAHLILYKLLPLAWAYPIEFFFQYVVLFLGMSLFLRGWVTARAASIFGAITFTFFGFSAFHFVHINALAVICHLPWTLWLIDELFDVAPQTGRRRWIGIGLAVLTGSELLMGYPQTVWIVKLAEFLYVLARASPLRQWRPLAVYILYTAAGVLLGGVQLLPTWEALNRSQRSQIDGATILHGSLHPLNFTQLVAPYLFRDRFFPESDLVVGQPIRLWEMGVYQGALIVPLVCWLFLRWSALSRGQRSLARFFIGLALLGCLLALGRHGPFAQLLVRTPLIQRFRIPARYLLLVHLSLAVLVAIAIDDLVRDRDNEPRAIVALRCWLALIPLASAGCCAGIWLWASYRPHGLPPLGTCYRVLFNIPLLAVATALVALSSRWPRQGLVGILIFAIADFALYFLRLTIREPGSVRPLTKALSELPQFPPVPAGYRLHAVAFRPGATRPRRPPPCLPVHVSLAGLSMTDGYVALVPSRRLDFDRLEVQRLAGVVWAWDEHAALWSPISGALARVRCVTSAVVSDEPSSLATLALETTGVVPSRLPVLGGPPGNVAVVRDRPGWLVADMYAPASQLLVWNESFHPGWAASIDGHPQAVIRVNLDYLGCVVPKGRHFVVFRFQPRSFQVGAMVSASGVVLLFLSLAVGNRRIFSRSLPDEYPDERPGRAP